LQLYPTARIPVADETNFGKDKRQRFPARAATAQGLAAKNPGRALVAASGAPITNSLAELYTLQRFIQPDPLAERGIQEFDAWEANFVETRTELELQPSGLYKPVTRFCEFVNVPALHGDLSHGDRRRAEVRPAAISEAAVNRRRAPSDHRRPS
jgi:N12 class adenine-specific DNA methylase